MTQVGSKDTVNPEVTQTSSAAKKGSRPSRVTLLAIALLLILIVAGVYFIKKSSSGGSYTFNYGNDTVSYVLPSQGAGYKVSINRPDAIKTVMPGISDHVFTQYFGHTDSRTTTKQWGPILAFVGMRSRPYPKPKVLGTDNYRDEIAKTLNNPSSERYKATTTNARSFAQALYRYRQSITLGAASHFTNANIKKYAWQFDLTASDSKYKNLSQQGKVVYVLGDHGWYYILVSAEKNNWQNNQDLFQKVLSSIKVDQ